MGRENKNKYNGNEIQNDEFENGIGLELYDFTARTYDQQLGRFIQIDPLTDAGEQESWSSYHYSYNNPVTFNDPNGEFPIIPIIWALIAASSTETVVVSTVGASLTTLAIAKTADALENGEVAFNNAGVQTFYYTSNGTKISFTEPAVSSQTGKTLAASGTLGQTAGKLLAKGSNNQKTRDAAKIGQEAHRQEQAKLKQQGAKTEQNVELKDGTIVRKDAVRPDGTKVIIKPNTKSGNASAKRREKLMKENNHKSEIITYDPSNPAYLPGSPTYIGPKKIKN
ncbi:MAG: hypothetical protein IPP73_11565 [Chitinophagaceae bacterium]|nr:hypothetical protein [Chitinophagaceae bacterium]